MTGRAVFGVIGCSGGVGASTFAAVLASVARAVLVDVDSCGGGIDVLLGVEAVPGARWSGVRVDGGRLDPHVLRSGLPRWGPCSVLAADGPVEPDALVEVIDAASSAGVVVLDLARSGSPERDVAVDRCSLAVLLARADVVGIAAGHAVTHELRARGVRVGLVARRGPVAAAEAAQHIGVPLLGVLPALHPAPLDLARRRLPRASARLAAGLLDGVRADGVRADGVRADGVRADGVRADGVRADHVRALVGTGMGGAA